MLSVFVCRGRSRAERAAGAVPLRQSPLAVPVASLVSSPAATGAMSQPSASYDRVMLQEGVYTAPPSHNSSDVAVGIYTAPPSNHYEAVHSPLGD